MEALILTIIATSIPLLLAATGELITEKSGVLNLGAVSYTHLRAHET